MGKRYEAPSIKTIGSVQRLTETGPDKCGGSGDQFLPQQLSTRFGTPHC